MLPVHAQVHAGTYLGLDRNDYPGDSNMAVLRKTFAFTGYWLNNPPGANHNSWRGNRKPAASDWATAFCCCSMAGNMQQLKAPANAAA